MAPIVVYPDVGLQVPVQETQFVCHSDYDTSRWKHPLEAALRLSYFSLVSWEGPGCTYLGILVHLGHHSQVADSCRHPMSGDLHHERAGLAVVCITKHDLHNAAGKASIKWSERNFGSLEKNSSAFSLDILGLTSSYCSDVIHHELTTAAAQKIAGLAKIRWPRRTMLSRRSLRSTTSFDI